MENTKQQIKIKVDDVNSGNDVNMKELMEEINKKYKYMEVNANMDNYIALEMDYTMNYTVEQLKHICKYYNMSIRKKNKSDLVETIVIFEADPENLGEVIRRKYLWECVEQINMDPYLGKFLNINV